MISKKVLRKSEKERVSFDHLLGQVTTQYYEAMDDRLFLLFRKNKNKNGVHVLNLLDFELCGF